MLYNFLLLNGTEMIGFGLAGICRRWLVYPSDMIWPRVLQSSTFLNTMHRDKNVAVGRWTISRYKIFFISIIACFGYSFLPQFIPFLDKMDIITMIWPKSKIVNLLFGVNQGLALLPLTLSWQTVVTWLGNTHLGEINVRKPAGGSSRSTRQYSCRNDILVLDRCWGIVC
jgi:hypothetical protein